MTCENCYYLANKQEYDRLTSLGRYDAIHIIPCSCCGGYCCHMTKEEVYEEIRLDEKEKVREQARQMYGLHQ